MSECSGLPVEQVEPFIERANPETTATVFKYGEYIVGPYTAGVLRIVVKMVEGAPLLVEPVQPTFPGTNP